MIGEGGGGSPWLPDKVLDFLAFMIHDTEWIELLHPDVAIYMLLKSADSLHIEKNTLLRSWLTSAYETNKLFF